EFQALMDESNRLGGEAKGRDGPDPVAWDRAIAVAENADTLLRLMGDEPGLRAMIDTTLNRLRDERQGASMARDAKDRDQRLATTIEDNRLSLPKHPDGTYDYANWIRANLSAFRDYGLDLETLSEDEAVKRVQRSVVRGAIVTALDDMAVRADDLLAARLLR